MYLYLDLMQIYLLLAGNNIYVKKTEIFVSGVHCTRRIFHGGGKRVKKYNKSVKGQDGIEGLNFTTLCLDIPFLGYIANTFLFAVDW